MISVTLIAAIDTHGNRYEYARIIEWRARKIIGRSVLLHHLSPEQLRSVKPPPSSDHRICTGLACNSAVHELVRNSADRIFPVGVTLLTLRACAGLEGRAWVSRANILNIVNC
jgi:hypothetical protein